MEFGKLVEMVMTKYGYDRLQANAFVASMFYSAADDKTIKRVVKSIEEDVVAA